jgi:DMSO/TMAO reductase YedYZ molybdopterin-dependent catalytic subunit
MVPSQVTEDSMKRVRVLSFSFLLAAAVVGLAAGRAEALPLPPAGDLASADPALVDISTLTLGTVESLHPTGSPLLINDISQWRLHVKGAALDAPLELSYADLQSMPTVTKKVLLVCPGFFADFVEWEGVPLSALLDTAGARQTWSRVVFTSWDGYPGRFDREEADAHLLFLALKVNGETLPVEHGFPVRLVAEHLYGGRWVKWITSVTVD